MQFDFQSRRDNKNPKQKIEGEKSMTKEREWCNSRNSLFVITLIPRRKSACSEELPPVEVPTKALNSLLGDSRNKGHSPSSWSEWIIVLIFKKRTCNEHSNHREISFIQKATKFSAPIVLCCLTPVRENNIRGQQAGLCPGQGSIGQIAPKLTAYSRKDSSVLVE